jgi:hypothetical protein
MCYRLTRTIFFKNPPAAKEKEGNISDKAESAWMHRMQGMTVRETTPSSATNGNGKQEEAPNGKPVLISNDFFGGNPQSAIRISQFAIEQLPRFRCGLKRQPYGLVARRSCR